MATAQKRGFRFPWESDPRRDEPAPPSDEPTLAQRLGTIPDDLGRGPFDLSQAEPEGPVATDEATSAEAASTTEPDAAEPGTAEPGTAEPRAAAGEPDAQPSDLPIATIADKPPAPAAPSAEHVAEPPAQATEATAPTAGATSGEPPAGPTDPLALGTAWPENDRRSKGGTPSAIAGPRSAPSKAAAARHDNPLMAGLVRAMREATRVARDEALASLRAEADARGEAIRARTTANTAELRKSADADVTAIREWSKAEMARIRQETESRIAARRVLLVAETEGAAAAAGDLFARLIATVHGYESETADFFDVLMAEDDPARLAGMAERMPSPPSLDGFPAGSAGPAQALKARSSKGHGAAVRSASNRPGAPTPRATKHVPPEPEVRVAADVAPATEAAPSSEVAPAGEVAPADEPAMAFVAELEREPESDGLDADAAAAAEAAALVGLDGQTQLIVSGLVSVGGIAAFKAALMRVPDVSAVSVTAATDGDFQFTVTHSTEADVRNAIRDLEAFQARIIADDGTSLVVVAHEPAA